MAFRFEELKIWHLAVDLSNQVDFAVEKFPRKEQFNLAAQIKRAADSVVLNIAEGSTGQSIAEFRRFLNIALRSAVEVVACLYLARKRLYITEEEYQELYDHYDHLCRMITRFREAL